MHEGREASAAHVKVWAGLGAAASVLRCLEMPTEAVFHGLRTCRGIADI